MRALAAAALLGLLLAHLAAANTKPEELAALEAFRDAMLARPGQQGWSNALASWRCPLPGGGCDVCGKGSWSAWDHVACRGPRLSFTKYAAPGTGVVTNVHITDYGVEGPVPIKELCAFRNLREFDLDGGHLTGPVPSEFAECFPDLNEIDLSYNQLSGTIPKQIGDIKTLEQFKVENNQITGGIPSELGNLGKLSWVRFGNNRMSGMLPSSFRRLAPRLNQVAFQNNDFEGNLYALAEHSLLNTGTHNNPKLCGMVPVGVRYAHGFNYYGTKLGLPCPEELAKGLD